MAHSTANIAANESEKFNVEPVGQRHQNHRHIVFCYDPTKDGQESEKARGTVDAMCFKCLMYCIEGRH